MPLHNSCNMAGADLAKPDEPNGRGSAATVSSADAATLDFVSLAL